MKRLRVFGHATVTVSTIIEVGDNEHLTEEEIYDRARENFGGIMSFVGNGGTDKLIGVGEYEETIAADDEPEFDDYAEEG